MSNRSEEERLVSLGNGQSFTVRAQVDPTHLGLRVWPVTDVVVEYLATKGLAPATRVLELGAGTGALAIAMATLGARVLATDLPCCLGLLRKNTASSSRVTVRELSWGSEPDVTAIHAALGGEPELVVACDCVYGLENIGASPLVATLDALVGCGRVLVAYQVRDADIEGSFWRQMRDVGFTVAEKIHGTVQDSTDESQQDAHVFICRRLGASSR